MTNTENQPVGLSRLPDYEAPAVTQLTPVSRTVDKNGSENVYSVVVEHPQTKKRMTVKLTDSDLKDAIEDSGDHRTCVQCLQKLPAFVVSCPHCKHEKGTFPETQSGPEPTTKNASPLKREQELHASDIYKCPGCLKDVNGNPCPECGRPVNWQPGQTYQKPSAEITGQSEPLSPGQAGELVNNADETTAGEVEGAIDTDGKLNE